MFFNWIQIFTDKIAIYLYASKWLFSDKIDDSISVNLLDTAHMVLDIMPFACLHATYLRPLVTVIWPCPHIYISHHSHLPVLMLFTSAESGVLARVS